MLESLSGLDFWPDTALGWADLVHKAVVLPGLLLTAMLALLLLWRRTAAALRDRRADLALRQTRAAAAAERRIIEAFTKAVAQLGHPNVAVTLGAIYAIERIAREHPSCHWQAMEVLAGFVRSVTPLPERIPEEPGADMFDGGEREIAWRRAIAPDGARCRVEAEAAVAVIARRYARHDPPGALLDLGGSDLSYLRLPPGADLTRCDLSHSLLIGAILPKVQLGGAALRGARFDGAQLPGADLAQAQGAFACYAGAVLYRSGFRGADLRYANFCGAHVLEANMDADLQGARLCAARFQKVRFGHASLEDADLTNAIIDDCDLADVRGLRRSQLEPATVSRNTALPLGARPPP